ncbi:hypothetical protein CCP3SC1_2150002 [Gammaproteobacteria bacterium]
MWYPSPTTIDDLPLRISQARHWYVLAETLVVALITLLLACLGQNHITSNIFSEVIPQIL